MKYLLSIVIPTKNRSYYCLHAIKQILALDLQNIEICIQDNSDTDELRKEIGVLAANNIVYNYHGGILSFVDNFSEAVSLANGEYLCMIGDDDGVLPCICDLVDDLQKQGADAAIPEPNFVYFWPSNQKIIEGGDNGTLLLHLQNEFKKADGVVVNHNKALKQLLNNGVQNYTSLDMPRLYHGVVRRSVLDRIKETTGHYFGGLTPDMYMAVALCFVCTKVLRVRYSVTISGICPTSGSSDSATGKHTGELKDAPHFRGHNDYTWDSLVPQFYSVDTIWADTLLHTIREFNRIDLLNKFNSKYFDGICIKKYPQYNNTSLQHALTLGYTVNSIKWSLAMGYVRMLIERISRKIRFVTKKGIGRTTLREFNVANIEVAKDRVSSITYC